MNTQESYGQNALAVSQTVEHLFRQESAKMVAILTGIFGTGHLTLAEDVVQETLARALQTWPYYGVPRNPSAWILRVARNLALDVVRREKVFREKEAEIVVLLDRPGPSPDETAFSDGEISDERLRMMFVCFHPQVPADAQVALALTTLCGFGVNEVSRALLSTEAAVAKRLVRAKQKIRDAKIPFVIPEGKELVERLDGVLQTLYLLFNEGYKASSGDRLVREDICHEAIRLTDLLAAHSAGNKPKTHALLALMLFNTARIKTRVDEEGNLLRLQDQDRAQWDKAMIARGMFHFARSAAGNELTEYHVQSGIAACHCTACDYASTDWKQILMLYDRLMEIDRSPVIALNRAVVIANVHGPEAGLEALESIEDRKKLESYYLLYAVKGELESRANRFADAVRNFTHALELTAVRSEQVFLSRRIQECRSKANGDPNEGHESRKAGKG